MTHMKKIFLFTIAVFFVFSATAWSSGIKDRMKQRLPVISSLKNKGIVGETNQGYLAFVSSTVDRQDVVSAENKDRRAIYQHIAKQQSVSLELVQKRRAKALAERVKPGHYYQNEAGAWVKK
ncbi:MAG: YdbL family protein [Desulfobacter sp.]|nr:YdbL family protein [Desulfobacter sp.]WDP86553.1 MAG: YdbL family protein [Desulfobacter sp.]